MMTLVSRVIFPSLVLATATHILNHTACNNIQICCSVNLLFLFTKRLCLLGVPIGGSQGIINRHIPVLKRAIEFVRTKEV